MYALCADKLCAAALSRFPARAYAESKCFCCARNLTEPRLDGGQPGAISELRRDPEGFEKFAVMNPCMNTGACPWLLTHLADSIQRDIQTETIGTMTDARSKMAQHFYVARLLVATTRMLLRCKPFHRS